MEVEAGTEETAGASEAAEEEEAASGVETVEDTRWAEGNETPQLCSQSVLSRVLFDVE